MVNSDGNDFLVTWAAETQRQDGGANPDFRLIDSWGRRVSPDGSFVDEAPFPIATARWHAACPLAGYGAGRYLVAWRDHRLDSPTVWGQLLDAGATGATAPTAPGPPAGSPTIWTPESSPVAAPIYAIVAFDAERAMAFGAGDDLVRDSFGVGAGVVRALDRVRRVRAQRRRCVDQRLGAGRAPSQRFHMVGRRRRQSRPEPHRHRHLGYGRRAPVVLGRRGDGQGRSRHGRPAAGVPERRDDRGPPRRLGLRLGRRLHRGRARAGLSLRRGDVVARAGYPHLADAQRGLGEWAERHLRGRRLRDDRALRRRPVGTAVLGHHAGPPGPLGPQRLRRLRRRVRRHDTALRRRRMEPRIERRRRRPPGAWPALQTRTARCPSGSAAAPAGSFMPGIPL